MELSHAATLIPGTIDLATKSGVIGCPLMLMRVKVMTIAEKTRFRRKAPYGKVCVCVWVGAPAGLCCTRTADARRRTPKHRQCMSRYKRVVRIQLTKTATESLSSSASRIVASVRRITIQATVRPAMARPLSTLRTSSNVDIAFF